MKKIKIAQIGAEHDHACHAIRSLKKQSDVFEVAGYAVPEGEKLCEPEAYEGVCRMSVEELLAIPDLEAVAIETSEINLTKYAIMAAEKGLAIHMDKPGGTQLSDFEHLIELVKSKNIVFHTGYMYRYNAAVIKLLQDIKEGKLGEIYSVEAHMSCMHTQQKRQWLGTYKGGMMFYLGCHLIDLIYQIMGEPEEVIPLNCATGVDGVTAEDFGMAVLRYKNGASFAKTSALEPGGFMRRQLVVCGSKGTVQLLPIEAPAFIIDQYADVREVMDDIFEWSNDGVRYQTERRSRYDTMLHSFAEYVRGEKENPYSYEYELNLYKLVLRCCGM